LFPRQTLFDGVRESAVGYVREEFQDEFFLSVDIAKKIINKH
jgi:hypothetical protein